LKNAALRLSTFLNLFEKDEPDIAEAAVSASQE
jgi:hypothetical protein